MKETRSEHPQTGSTFPPAYAQQGKDCVSHFHSMRVFSQIGQSQRPIEESTYMLPEDFAHAEEALCQMLKRPEHWQGEH